MDFRGYVDKYYPPTPRLPWAALIGLVGCIGLTIMLILIGVEVWNLTIELARSKQEIVYLKGRVEFMDNQTESVAPWLKLGKGVKREEEE
jgi:hypothetical protein